jgi:2-C-methyl-D-erythritol 4-phosphate cytidylyltransferase
MKKKTIGVILAAGGSSRFLDLENDDLKLPQDLKQYRLLKDKYIIQYSIDNFLALKEMEMIDEILVIIRKEDENFFQKEILEKEYSDQISEIKLSIGGQTRSESVLKASEFIKKNFSDLGPNYVLIHDSARPFASLHLFLNLINHIIQNDLDCVFPALKLSDAIRLIKDKIYTTVDRKNLYSVQTPQIFDYSKLLLCFEFEQKNHISEYPLVLNYFDEVTLFEKYKGKIGFINGEKENIKITLKDDLDQK